MHPVLGGTCSPYVRMWKPILTSAIAITECTRVSSGRCAVTRWIGTWVATLCLAGFGGAPVQAGDLIYGAGYSLTYDSNINRVPSGALAEWTQALMGMLNYQERSIDFNAQILAQVERRNYLRNTYPDQTIYNVNGAAVWTISPRQFTWTVEDVARQVVLNITAPDTPSNRTNTNAFRTGPDFTLRLDPTNNVVIGAKYGRYTITGPGDTKSYSGNAALVHRVSELTTLSLNYVATRLYPLDLGPLVGGPRIDIRQAFLSLQTTRPLGTLILDAGTNSFTQEGTAISRNDRLVRLLFLRDLSSAQSLRLSFDSQYFVTSTELLSGVTNPTQSTAGTPSTPPTIVATQDAYYSRGGDLSYLNQSAGSFVLGLGASGRHIDYQNPLNSDYDERGGRIEGTWLSSDATRIRVRTDYTRRTFQQDPIREDHLFRIGMGVSFSPTQNVSISVDADRLRQSSSQPQFDFLDQRAMLTLTYTSAPLRR